MYSIRIGNDLLDIDASQIDLRQFNNAFNQDNTPADFTYDFDILLTAKNRRVLGFPDSWQVDQVAMSLSATFILFGKSFPAKLRVRSAGKSSIIINMTISAGSFEVLGRKLVNIPLDFDGASYGFLSASSPNFYKNSFYPDVPWCCPTIINGSFYSGNNPSYAAWINRFNPSTGQYILNSFDVVTGTAQNFNAMVPMPYLLWVLEKGFGKMGLRIDGEAYRDTYMRRLFLYANYSVENPESLATYQAKAEGPGSSVSLVTISTSFKLNFSNSLGTAFNTVTDEWTVPAAGTYKVKLRFTINQSTSAGQNLVVHFWVNGGTAPTIALTQPGIEWTNGTYEIEGEIPLAAGDVTKGLSVRLQATSSPSAYLTDMYFEIERKETQLVNEFGAFSGWPAGLPDITFGELLTACRKPPLGLDFEYDFEMGMVYINFKNKVVDRVDSQQSVDLEKGSIRFTHEEKKAMIFRYKEPENDSYVEEFLPQELVQQTVVLPDGSWYIDGYGNEIEGAQVIEPDMFPIQQLSFAIGSTINLARLEQPGYSTMFETDRQDPGLRIAFYGGIINGWPMALSKYYLPLNYQLWLLNPNQGIMASTCGRFYNWLIRCRALEWSGWLKVGNAAIWSVLKPISITGLKVIQKEVTIEVSKDQLVKVSGKGLKA